MDSVKKEGGSRLNWTCVAERVNESSDCLPRTGKQCRERWQNHLRPDIKKGNWSAEEADMIKTLYQTFGSK
jgi:hypothetical protein